MSNVSAAKAIEVDETAASFGSTRTTLSSVKSKMTDAQREFNRSMITDNEYPPKDRVGNAPVVERNKDYGFNIA